MKKTLVIALLALVTLAGQAQENNYTAENKSKENCRKSLASKPISQPRRNHPAGLFFALLRLKCASCRISFNETGGVRAKHDSRRSRSST